MLRYKFQSSCCTVQWYVKKFEEIEKVKKKRESVPRCWANFLLFLKTLNQINQKNSYALQFMKITYQ